MAKHRKAAPRRAVPGVLVGATAGMSAVLVFSADASAATTLPQADTVIGVGGWRNPTGDRIPDKFQGQLVPDGATFVPVEYPAELPVDPSVTEGVPTLRTAIDDTGGTKLVVGYSEGSLVAEQVKRDFGADGGPPPDELQFLFIAAPFVPNGGIYARFPELAIPGSPAPARRRRRPTTRRL
nr:PE-PPE domain-containing protein [Mycobacterium sp. QGD 101]